jgi:hypothetical protein
VTAVVIGTLAIVAATVAIGIVVERKIGLLTRGEELAPPARPPPPAHGAGEAAATAIRASVEQLARLRTTQRCATCRAAMTSDDDDRVRYADHELIVLQLRCAGCGSKRTLYVEAT